MRRKNKIKMGPKPCAVFPRAAQNLVILTPESPTMRRAMEGWTWTEEGQQAGQIHREERTRMCHTYCAPHKITPSNYIPGNVNLDLILTNKTKHTISKSLSSFTFTHSSNSPSNPSI